MVKTATQQKRTVYLDATIPSFLREKWRVQRELARKAGHDVARYLDLVEENVKEWAKANGIRLHYADISQLAVRPPIVKEAPATYTTRRAKRVSKTA